jgi:TolA-binding protein
VGQIIEIPFQGAGWVYLGELRSRLGVAYNSRRSDPEGQTFIFRAEEPGTFGLKFYKQDYVRDYILNDYVQVIVDETPVRELFAPSRDPIRVISAPRRPYLPGEEPAAEAAGITDRAGDSRTEDASVATAVPSGKAEAPQTPPVQTPGPADRDDDSIVPAAPPRSPTGDQAATGDQPIEDGGSALPEEDMLPEDYFRKAREAFEGGQIQPALVILDQFRERYPQGGDEAWWLYGQFLEAAGPARNIRLALDYYRRLVRDYPQSPRYNDARGRIAYLERFYFNIR